MIPTHAMTVRVSKLRTRKWLAALVLVAGVFAGARARGADAGFDPVVALQSYDVVWDSPSANSDGSMPIGNGDFAANVWANRDGDVCLLLSKSDAWDGNGMLLKLGRIRLQLSPNPIAGAKVFKQELDLHRGEVVIRAEHPTNGAATIRIWFDANQPVAHVEVDADRPVSLTVKHETWRTEPHTLTKGEVETAYGLRSRGRPVVVEPDTMLHDQRDRLVFFHRNTESMWAETQRLQVLPANPADDPLMNRTFGAIVEGPGLSSRSADELVSIKPQKHQEVSLYPLTAQTATAAEWVAKVEQNIKRVQRTAIDAARAAHEKWWDGFWRRSWIFVEGDADAQAVTRGYTLQRWINACAGRGGAPIKFNGSLFTVAGWSKGKITRSADYRRWGACYWWQNTRLPYWSMLEAGDFDMMKPLFKTYMDALPMREQATQIYYKHGGTYFPETMYFWGSYNGDNYGWNRSKKTPDGLTAFNRNIRYNWGGGIELTQMMLDYYSYTGDDAFRDRVLLFAKQITDFYDQHYKRDQDGKLLIYPSNALEDVWDCTNPAEVISGLRTVLPRLIALAPEGEQKRAWSRLLTEIPPLPEGKAEDGRERLLEAAVGRGHGNGEKPDLYALFPYRLLSLANPGALGPARVAYELRHKRNGGWTQDGIFAACLGNTGDARDLLVFRFTHKHGASRFPAFWGPNYDWNPDQDHGTVGMLILQNMLMQPVGDKLLLLPAWPKTWSAHFKLHGLRGTTVEAECRDGKVRSLTVTPESRRADVVIEKPAE